MRDSLVNLLPERVGEFAELTSGITVTLLAEQTKQGGAIWELAADSSLECHMNSGGFSAFSADSAYLAVKRSLLTASGDNASKWYAVKLADKSITEMMPRNDSGDVNANVVWAPTGSEFFRLRAGVLERWAVGGGSPVAAQALASSLSHHSGGSASTLSYRLQVGSGRTNPALLVYASGWDEHAVVPFDPTTLALSPHWWVQSALEAGVAAGTTPQSVGKAHNLVAMGSGYSFVVQANARSQYVPANGATAVAIEPPTPNRSHPAIRGLAVVYGEGSTGKIACADWGDPPVVNQGNETERWSMAKASLRTQVFPAASNDGYVQFHHADVGNAWAVMSLLNTDSQAEATPAAVIKVNMTDGSFVHLRDGWNYDSTGDFTHAARPSISFDDAWAVHHREVDGLTRVYLMGV